MTSNSLFAAVFYYLSKALPPQQRSQLSQVLDLNGAQAVGCTDARLTHYVASLPPGPESLDALPQHSTAQLVTPLWIERTLILGAAQEAAYYSPSPTMLFSGVVATSCDLSASDNEVLSAGISSLGGQWRSALTKDVTHLFALSTGSQKYETAMHFKDGTGMKVLLPHWFDDVVRLGVRSLPTDEYEWPDPKLFKVFGAPGDEARTDKRFKSLSAERKAFYDTALLDAKDLPAQTEESRNVWKDMTIVLGSSLDLNASQRQAHSADIMREGGFVLEFDSSEDELAKIQDADIYITRYRSGPTFVQAYRSHKTIGTLTWLWFVRATGTLSRPTDQLLHYPIPRSPIENFSKHIITVTNYTGKDREYIKKLITIMGAEFTASMSGKNTVVVAAYLSGTKTSKAASWGIPVVNHLWLEDCFSQWRDIATANEKYVVFPPGVDFGTVLTEERGLSIGRIGYDQDELDAMERDVLAQESTANESRPPSQPRKGILKKASSLAVQNSMASVRSVEEVENVVPLQESASNYHGDVPLTSVGDVSAGAYHDIDVPLNDDGRLSLSGDSDLEGQQGNRRDADFGSRTSPRTPIKAGPSKASAKSAQSRATPAKQPATPITSRSSKAKAVLTASRGLSSDEDDSDSSVRRRNKTVGRPPPSSRRSTTKENVRDAEWHDSDGEYINRSAKKGSVIKTYRTRSRSRSRSRPELDMASHRDSHGHIPMSPPRLRKARDKTILSDEDDVPTVSASKSKTPRGGALTGRRKPALPSDTEASEVDRGRSQRKLGRKSPRASLPNGGYTRVTRTPSREMSVLLPTLAQVRSATSQRVDKNIPPTAQASATSQTEAVALQAQVTPASVPRKRGRPRKKPVEEPVPALSGESERSQSPVRMKISTADRTKDTTPEAGPSYVAGVPESSTRTASKRSAAAKATQKLHNEIMPDVMSFQKELKNGNVRRAVDVEKANAKKTITEDKKPGKKRASLETDSAERSDGDEPETKRQKTLVGMRKMGKQSDIARIDALQEDAQQTKSRNKPGSMVETLTKAGTTTEPAAIVVMTTQVILPDETIKYKAFTKLGVKFTTKPFECTHLVARSIVRTEKFLCAMAYVSYVVSVDWVEKCVTKKTMLSPESYTLRDPQNEKKYGFKLSDSLARARANKGKLFEGKTFYMTPKVPVEVKLMKNVVTAGGGQLSTQTPTVRIMKGGPNRYVISSPADIAIWRPLAEQGCPIYNQELILTGMLRQVLDWESPSNRVPDSNL